MNQNSTPPPNKTKPITDQEAIEHLKKIDGKLKGKNNMNLFLMVLCLISIAANVAQYLNYI